ncbi:type IV pilus modification PilV family protein [Desulfospira joergensenii]|uniref:type IV pilus modification PilV family protein n=1 Tax=Desulfospira joergensenii TaxID=53329 RepID=UPI0003F86C99|nr:prepilin-type N-terminal cleavage/methylation domain-containing protein [Desulfospira joergensenii]
MKTASKPISPGRHARENTGGFTLLEVMIAVSIIALVFVSLFRMQSGTIRLAGTGSFNVLAPALAGQVLAEMEQDLADWNKTSGDFGELYPGYKWTCEISESVLNDLDFIDEDKNKAFKKIRLKIMDRQEQQTYEITTWRLALEE